MPQPKPPISIKELAATLEAEPRALRAFLGTFPACRRTWATRTSVRRWATSITYRVTLTLTR